MQLVQYYYPERESKSLEFKSKLPQLSQLVKTCAAFANGVGGKIIIGVDDNTHEIIGINDEIRNKVYDEFPNSLYDMTTPNLLAEIYERNFGERSIMVIEIPQSIKKPVFITKEGLPKGVYLRAGSNTRKANQEYVEELMRENKRTSFDEETIAADPKILSEALLKSAFGRVNTERLITEKVLIRLPANSEKYYPTVAGVLLFCENPEAHIPEAIVQCTRFSGISGRDIIQSETIHGYLEKQIETSFQLVKSWLIRNYALSGTKLKGKMMVPPEALREAITNALIHRKYWIPGAVKIALYDNRLEIFSPGNFPGLIDVTHLGDGTTYLRNPNLARIARRLGVIEKLGTGIRLILESCQKMGIKEPEFIEGADSVKVIFPFLPAVKASLSDRDKLLTFFKMHREARLSEIETYLGVSRNTATRKLAQLIKAGKIQRVGKGPAVKYFLLS